MSDRTLQQQFRDCKTGFVGQVADAAGARCADVCRTFGYAACRGRAGQSDFNACTAEHSIVGECDEVFDPGWSSQCDCR